MYFCKQVSPLHFSLHQILVPLKKVLSFENEKKNLFSFCILLTQLTKFLSLDKINIFILFSLTRNFCTFALVKAIRRLFNAVVVAVVVTILAACSATKFVPEGDFMLQSVKVKSEPTGFDVASVEPYIRQKANSKWFSLLKIPLGVYSMAGRDTTKWLNRTLQRIGEEPVIFDSTMAVATCGDLQTALRNRG